VAGVTRAPSLVLDPSLPSKTWERRTGTNRAFKRSRYELTPELLVEAMEDPKTEKIAFGEEAHAELRRILGTPGFKTPGQRAAEEAAKLSRDRPPPARPRTVEAPRCGQGFRLDPLPWDRPDPPGTLGPGGAAS
jgi:hypothetical protein